MITYSVSKCVPGNHNVSNCVELFYNMRAANKVSESVYCCISLLSCFSINERYQEKFQLLDKMDITVGTTQISSIVSLYKKQFAYSQLKTPLQE